MRVRTIDTLDDIADGLEALVQIDPRLVPVVRKAGAVPLRRQAPGFQGLAEIIVAQMVSKASAAAIWSRLAAEAGGCAPHQIAALSDAQCRRIGLSRAKEQTLRGAAEAVMSGRINPRALCAMPADESIAAMTALKGIGAWTAEVYLLFCAGHGDIFPAGDVALQAAAAHALGIDTRPDQKKLRDIAARWQPWRGVAARLLWAYYATEMRRGDVTPTG
ncbi:DNA-3-methyladenine glycosylase 2 family protein [Nitratireductor sp. XY-223]|uniref:DNA-3-methyladenine glycosylase family protein n=1 Tax=Nitratireductor sp. XY-223 TaxID=2561926 RepID=UPI00145BCED7|nr:DNA-3-methyladenine glycosylase 2 family protein [Nitratireductor sp. XY-223]